MNIVDQIFCVDFGFNPNQAAAARQKFRGNDLVEFYLWQHWMQAKDDAERDRLQNEYNQWLDEQ